MDSVSAPSLNACGGAGSMPSRNIRLRGEQLVQYMSYCILLTSHSFSVPLQTQRLNYAAQRSKQSDPFDYYRQSTSREDSMSTILIKLI